jgi:hypothetical protein
VLSHHKVLVLVQEVLGLVRDRAGIMLDGEGRLAELGAGKALAAADRAGAVQLLGQVLWRQQTT